MECHRCGTTLPTNATGCPRCDSGPARTKKLSQTDLNKTRALVPVERCENCGWLVYATDNECTACGAWINRPWKQNAGDAKPRRERKRRETPVAAPSETFHTPGSSRVWMGVVVGVLVLGLTAWFWHYLFGSHLQ